MIGPDGQQLDEAEREALDARRAAREKERAENMAQIAPSVGSTAKRPNAPKQKTQQVFKSDMTKEEIARARIKYEEALPWHLEDFDNRNVWVGNYEAALSETHAVFVLENNKMRMIPAEKWYKFSAKQQFKALTIEEAEKHMSKRMKDPRWFMEKQKEVEMKKELDQFARQHKVYAGKQGGVSGREGLEASEMDFEEDRFADDEEHADLFNDEQDEDTKAAEQRIKEDQLKANVFDLKEEKDYEEEEEREKKEREARRTFGKKVRKALKKRERNYEYSSGSDANPYTDEEVRIFFSIEFINRQDTDLVAYRALTTARSNAKRKKKSARLRRKESRERRTRPHLRRAAIRPRVVLSTPTL
jgi:transcription initiation factor TFIIF subunit alpha